MKKIEANFISSDIPLLIGLDILDEYGWNVLTVENKLQCVPENWFMPIHRREGHVVVEWDSVHETYYTRDQLHNLHLHFMHPSMDKLCNLLKRATPSELNLETRSILGDISKSCHTCQAYSTKPITFQVRFPDDVVFNKEVRIDPFLLDSKATLSIVDVGTNFIAARFLAGESAEVVWNTFLYCWVLLYAGFPSSMLTD